MTDLLPWYRDARCAHPDVGKDWFHSVDRREQAHAKRICQGCPVKDLCLEDALLRGDDWGVWGGLTEKERRRLMRCRPVMAA